MLAASTAAFAALLAVRTDRLRIGPETRVGTPALAEPGRDTWMSIHQRDRKIGYSHRQVLPEAGGYSLQDTTYMRINTMGMVQDLHMRTTAALGPDLTVDRFRFTLRSNLFDFTVDGRRDGDALEVDMGDQIARIPLEGDLYLPGGVLDAAASSPMAVGESRTYSVFDPTTMGRTPVRVTAVAEEVLDIGGATVPTLRLELDYLGASQVAWIAADGSVVQEQGMMGITLKRVSQQEAFAGLNFSPSEDLTRAVSIPVRPPLPDPSELTALRLEVTGIHRGYALDGDRQSFDGRVLRVAREAVPDPDVVETPAEGAHLGPTPFIESDHPEIREIVDRIVSPGDRPLERVRKIIAWIHDNIEKRPLLSVPSALTTLRQRMGDCNEHAVLLAAMARAAGIPAQVEAGLVYMQERFYYHAWNAVYLDGWVTADALMGQLPADVTHLRFVRGEPRSQVDLMGVIGQVGLKVIETEVGPRKDIGAGPTEAIPAEPVAPEDANAT